MQPSIFLSHGAPDLLLRDVPARRFLEGVSGYLPRQPSAILVASAHWEAATPTVNAVETNATIHDFGGFDPALGAIRYPAPGDPALAARVVDLLAAAGLPGAVDERRGLDHGAWVPLTLAFADATIPVVQIAIQPRLGPAHHLALGRALAPLRSENILVIGSGSFTHDLASWVPNRNRADAPEPDWVAEFADWMDGRIANGATAELLAYRRLAPHALANHPTEEHLLPLFVTMGAGGPAATRLHRSTTHGVLRMDAYAFGAT